MSPISRPPLIVTFPLASAFTPLTLLTSFLSCQVNVPLGKPISLEVLVWSSAISRILPSSGTKAVNTALIWTLDFENDYSAEIYDML